MANVFDKKAMIEVMNDTFDDISWPIWKEKTDKIKVLYADKVDCDGMMFKLMREDMDEKTRVAFEKYFSKHAELFFDVISDLTRNYRMKVHIEKGKKSRKILFRLEFSNVVDENDDVRPLVISLAPQYAALYATFLKLGSFDMAKVTHYYFYKQYYDVPTEVEMLRHYYDIATGGVRDDDYLNRNVERMLTADFSMMYHKINAEIKKQLEIYDSQIRLKDTVIGIYIEQNLLIKEEGKLIRAVGIGREEVCDI